ncbi:MauE/DoxX family redox-associated membrane protein [Streptosporangium sp. NPDC049376]|uniref:MauE/DoxX family redox-associated membrane protein n=1 Tax=Streptosporangium sp. NPDC049376 TaxID=3366192 RepID=UPI00379F1524
MSGYLDVGGRCLLAVVFLMSTVGKARSPALFRAFAKSLRDLRVLPAGGETAAAALIVAAEATGGVLLVFDATATGGALLSAALLTVFAVVIAWSTSRGGSAGCRCFGASTRPLGRAHVVRNVLLALVAVFVAVASHDQRLLAPGTAVALITGGAVALVVARLDDIVDLFGASPDPRTPH